MNDPLATYLTDHLAGAMHAVETLTVMRDKHNQDHDSLGPFITNLLAEVEADRAVLQQLAERAGSGSPNLKEIAAWITEKISRLKLNHGPEMDLDTFEALEFVELGVHGKWALWRALGAIAPGDARLQGVDFEHLASRAQMQHDSIEQRRLDSAHVALRPIPH